MGKIHIVTFSTAYDPYIGGAEIAIQETARRLKDRMDFFVITARFNRELPLREKRGATTILRVGIGRGIDKWLLPILGVLRFIRWYWSDRRRGDHVALWGMDISQGSLAAALARLVFFRVPFVFTIQYGYGDERIARGRLGAINLAFRFMLAMADYVVGESTYLLSIARAYGYTRGGEVIPNGVDIKDFQRPVDALPLGSRIVITTSRLVPKNAVDILIRAIAEVKRTIPDVKCHIVGDGVLRGELDALVRELGLQGTVEFFGNIPYPKIPRSLHESAVFVRASRSEGMGNSFVEALAAGVPIIGTAVGGITDIIEDGKTGLFCRVDDPKDLAEKIVKLLEDRALAASIVENGIRMVRRHFSWDTIADSYEKVFRKSLTG